MLAWFKDLTAKERSTMLACFGGWSLDAFDVQMYSFVIPTVIGLWSLSKGEAGLIGTVTLLISSFGGWFSGTLADRFGRVRMLQITILWYSVFTFLCAFAQNFEQLFILRALHGFGFGGEWAAGAVLMGEVIRDKYRGRAVGLVQTGWAIGWGASALVYTAVYWLLPESLAWRVLFGIGLVPAVFVIWVRRHIAEAEIFDRRRSERAPLQFSHLFSAFRGPHVARTIMVSLMVAGAQGSGYALGIWMPTYLRMVRHLSATSTGGFLLVQILGALVGFLLGSYLSDAIGRKQTFLWSAILSFVAILLYMFIPMGNTALLFAGVPLYVVFLMKFPPMGPFMTELFPTEVRGNAQGFCYNSGRAIGAFFPTLVGYLSTSTGLGTAIAVCSAVASGVMIVMLLLLPETRGRTIAESDFVLVSKRRPRAGYRLARLNYLLFSLAAAALEVVLILLLSVILGGHPIILPLAVVLSVVIQIFLALARLRDIGSSPWWVLLLFVPFVNIFFVLFLLFERGLSQELPDLLQDPASNSLSRP